MELAYLGLGLKLTSLCLVGYLGIAIIKRTIKINRISTRINNIIAISCAGHQCYILRKK